MSFGDKLPHWKMYEAHKTKMVAMSVTNEFPTERAAALGEPVCWELALRLADLVGAVDVAATGLRVEETTGEVGDTLAGASPSSTVKYIP
jgi:hypothetical protein